MYSQSLRQITEILSLEPFFRAAFNMDFVAYCMSVAYFSFELIY